MDDVKVDLDEGRIYVEGEWLSSEELKYAIKTKISSDDYDVEHLSRAMKELEQIMDESTTLEIRVTNTLHLRLKDMGEDSGDTVGTIIRKALEGYIGGDLTPAEEPEEKPKKRGGRKKKEEPVEEPEVEEEEPEEEIEEEPEEEEEEPEEIEEEAPEEEVDEESDDDDLDVEHISRRRRRSSGSRR